MMNKTEKDEEIKRIIGRLRISTTNVRFCGPYNNQQMASEAINENASRLQDVSDRVNDLSRLMILLASKTEEDNY